MGKMLLLSLALLGATTSARAGSESHGGDIRDSEAGVAWFEQSSAKIKYCIQIADDFGVDSGTALAAIQSAFTTWKDYLIYRGIPSPHQDLHGELTQETEALPTCSGEEDLTFYLGLANADIATERLHYHDPVAFAHRTTFNPNTGWGKGYIWISGPRQVEIAGLLLPLVGRIDWKVKDALRVIVTHEIGHVLGNDHVADTVMDENIVRYLAFAGDVTVPGISQSNGSPSPLLTSVDWGGELISCSNPCMCAHDQILPGELGGSDPGGMTGRSVAKSLLGTDSGAPLPARAVVLQNSTGDCGKRADYALELQVNGEWQRFKIRVADSAVIDLGARFQRLTKPVNIGGASLGSYAADTAGLAVVSFGYLTTANDVLHVTIKHNAAPGSPLIISAQSGWSAGSPDQSHEIFRASAGWHP